MRLRERATTSDVSKCAEKNVRDFEPEHGTVMRRIATFAGLCAVEVLSVRIAVFFHAFKSLERLPKLATSSSSVLLLNGWSDSMASVPPWQPLACPYPPRGPGSGSAHLLLVIHA